MKKPLSARPRLECQLAKYDLCLLACLFLFFACAVSQVIGASPVNFFGAKTYGNGGSFYYGSQTGDFNGDGKLDVLTCSYLSVLVFYGDGSGEFLAPPVTAYSLDQQYVYPTVGDFNNDGKSDFVLSGRNPVGNQPTTTVLFGTAARTFSPPVATNLPVVPPYLVAVDFDGDGNLDVIGEAPISGRNAIISYKGNGSGGFSLTGQLFTDHDRVDVRTGDFNGDALPDIVYGDSDNLRVARNTGGGSFAPPVTLGSITYGFNTKLATDLNNDGKQDIVAVQNRSSSPIVAVWLGNGNFTFTRVPDFVISSTESVFLSRIADLNNDQKPDLIFSSPNRVIVVNGAGNGSFAPSVSYIDGGGSDIMVEDFNGDSRLDIAANQSVEYNLTGSGSFSILLNASGGGFRSAPALNIGDGVTDLAVADFNGDQFKDFVVVRRRVGGGPSEVSIFIQTAANNFNDLENLPPQASFSSVGVDARAVVTGDFNRDGRNDVIVVGPGANGTAQNGVILINNGDNTFTPTLFQIGIGDIYDAAAADVNSDGKLDVVTAGYLNVSISLGIGDGTFGAPVRYFSGSSGNNLATGDFNNDSRIDIAVTLFGDQRIGLLMNAGTGSFNPVNSVPQTELAYSSAVADLNRDGKVDLIVAKSDGVLVLSGNGSGTFNAGTLYRITPVAAAKLSVADFNGDGHLDVAALAGSNSIAVLLNDGAGGLGRETVWGGGAVLTCIAADDLNNDEKPDLIFGFSTSSTGYVKLLFNVTENQAATRKSLFDFDGDGRADISVFRPSTGAWYLQQSSAGFIGAQFGISTDRIVPADYDGDGKTDLGVYRSGVWYLQRSQLGFTGTQFGTAEDVPMPSDYDGDGKADLAVFRPSTGAWYLLQSTAGFIGTQFGQTGDRPVAADYDGDGKADLAVYRNGIWYLNRSQLGFTGFQFGTADDLVVPADYDGDGKTDLGVFRPSEGAWYLNRSSAGFTGVQFGQSGDAPAPGDYDGDGRADIVVFRNGIWYLNRSTAGFTGVSFGLTGDKSIPNAFVQ